MPITLQTLARAAGAVELTAKRRRLAGDTLPCLQGVVNEPGGNDEMDIDRDDEDPAEGEGEEEREEGDGEEGEEGDGESDGEGDGEGD